MLFRECFILFFIILDIENDCVLMKDSGLWNDDSCASARNFFCKSAPKGNICNN